MTIPRLQKFRHAHAKIKGSRAKLLTKLKNRVRTHELELWSRVRLAKTASIDGTGTTEVTIETQEEMDKLAHHLCPQKSIQPKDRLPIKIMEAHEPISVNNQELLAAEHALRNKKYAGPDGIRFSIFIRCLELEPELIRDIVRLSYATGHVPDHYKRTQGTLIPK